MLQKTKTLKKVASLIALATNKALTIEDVTVLDAFPLKPYDDFEKDEPKSQCRRRVRLGKEGRTTTGSNCVIRL